jgi:hypothetical protein
VKPVQGDLPPDLALRVITDLNGNRSEMAFDALERVVRRL